MDIIGEETVHKLWAPKRGLWAPTGSCGSPNLQVALRASVIHKCTDDNEAYDDADADDDNVILGERR